MSADPTPEIPQPAKLRNGGATPDRLWPWYLVTAIYLFGCSIILFDRASEFGDFFKPADGSPGRLRLNEIGDIAGGVFAPLAFLWLFVATQLQRRELRLQREELTETRAVFTEQQRELAKAASESNKQTEIMTKTLAQSSYREDYGLFGLDLYYLAMQFLQTKDNEIIVCLPDKRKVSTWLYGLPGAYKPSQNDDSTVDDFFFGFLKNLRTLQSELGADSISESTPRLDEISSNALQALSVLEGLQSVKKSTANDLVKSRYNALHLDELIKRMKVYF